VTFSIRYSAKCEVNPHADLLATPSSSIPLLSPKKSPTTSAPSPRGKFDHNVVLREFHCSSLMELYEWLTILGCYVEDVQYDEEVRYSRKKDSSQIGFRPRGLRKDFLAASPQKSIYYVNYTTRSVWTNLLNIENESAMLILLRFSNRYSQSCSEDAPSLQQSLMAAHENDSFSSMRSPVTPLEVMHVWAWLVENGCRLSHQNSLGNTALHYAITYRHREIIRTFLLMEHVRRSLSSDEVNYWDLKNNEGVSPAMMLKQEHLDLETSLSTRLIQLSCLCYQRKKEMESYRRQLSSLQAQKRRFSFLKIFFEKHIPLPRSDQCPLPSPTLPTSDDTEVDLGLYDISDPFLVISVRDSSLELLEAAAVVPFCLYRDHVTKAILWGEGWEMMTPLDIIPRGCTVHIELCSFAPQPAPPERAIERPSGKRQSGPKFLSQFFRPTHPLEEPETALTAASILSHPDRRVIASSEIVLDLDRLDSASQTIDFHLPAEVDPSPLHSRLDISLSCHCDLTSFDRTSFNLRSSQAQPEWIHHHRPLPIDGVRCGDISISSAENIAQCDEDDDPSALSRTPPFNFSKLFHAFPSALSPHDHRPHHPTNLLHDISADDISRMTFAELKYYLDEKKVNWKRHVKTMMRRALIAAKDR
jgi:hypothetical protein